VSGPLNGVRIVELGSFVSLPYAGLILAQLGAEVIKIELPNSGDPFRGWGEPGSVSPQFAAYNNGKKSVALDVRQEADRADLLRLAATADVVMDNFRPGRLADMGLTQDSLRAANPDVVLVSLTGFGSTGPYAEGPAYDAIAQAVSGLWSCFSDLSDPESVGPAAADQLSGLFAVIAVLSALYARDGRHSDNGPYLNATVTMLGSTAMFLASDFALALATGQAIEPVSRAARSQSFGLVASDGKAFAVHLSSPEKFWVRFTDAINQPELRSDPRFDGRAQRIANYSELRDELCKAAMARTRSDWLEILRDADVPAAPINSVGEALEDPQIQELGLIEKVKQGNGETIRIVGSPIVFGGVRCNTSGPVPSVGEHNSLVRGD